MAILRSPPPGRAASTEDEDQRPLAADHLETKGNTMTEYALYFETGGPVFGDGYTALARLSGRMLAVKTPTGFELYGVNPGGAAVFGATLNEAYAEFIEATRLVLVDIAAEGASFSNFRHEARSLFATVGRRTEARWLEARARARRGEIDTGLGLQIERDDRNLSIEVELLQNPTAAANAAPQEQAPAALAA